MALAEIGQRLGIGRTRVKQLIKRPDWPKPYDTIGVGRIWLAKDIERWIAKHRIPVDEEPEGH